MGTLGNMDGSFDGVLKASEQLKGLPKIIQKYMTAGIFQDELGWAKHFDDDSIDKLGGVDSFIVQIMNLDKAQQDALLSVSKFSDGLKEEIERLIQAARAGEKFNTQLFEQEASKDDKLSKGVLNEVMQTTGMKDADGNYLLRPTISSIRTTSCSSPQMVKRSAMLSKSQAAVLVQILIRCGWFRSKPSAFLIRRQ